MRLNRILLAVMSTLASTGALAQAQGAAPAAAGKIFCCDDAKGKRVCSDFLPPECQNPVILSEADRAASFNDGPGGVQKCDKTGDKWHRFTGAAGTKMPTSPPSVWSCGTDAPGWMKGEYPGVDDGIVDLSVCFAWIGNACEWSADIQLRNCGDFYVFRLPDPPETCLRYCGDA